MSSTKGSLSPQVIIEDHPRFLTLLDENSNLEMQLNMLKQDLDEELRKSEEREIKTKELELEVLYLTQQKQGLYDGAINAAEEAQKIAAENQEEHKANLTLQETIRKQEKAINNLQYKLAQAELEKSKIKL